MYRFQSTASNCINEIILSELNGFGYPSSLNGSTLTLELNEGDRETVLLMIVAKFFPELTAIAQ